MYWFSGITEWLGRTLTRKFSLLLAGFLALQAVQMLVVVFAFLHTGEEAAFINDAGRQRMRILLLAGYSHEAMHLAGRPADQQKSLDRLSDTAREYDEFYTRLVHFQGKRNRFEDWLDRDRMRPAFDLLEESRVVWEAKLRPLIVTVAMAPKARRAEAALAELEAVLPGQLQRIDQAVALMEADVTANTRTMALASSILLLVSLLLGISGFAMARTRVTWPLRRFIESIRDMADGAYDQRISVDSSDELGQLGETFNRMAEAIGAKTARITAFNRAAGSITSSLSIREILDQIMHHGLDVSGAKAACLAFYDEPTGCFNDRVTQGLSDRFVQNMSFRSGGLADETFATGTYILSNDRPGTRYPLSQLAREEGIRSFICLPLTSHTSRLGVVYFYRSDRDTFLPDEIDLLKAFSNLAAGALENARLYARVKQESRIDSLTGLLNRRTFDRHLVAEHNRASRFQKPYSLAILDIDHFKHVNDTYGHPAGDAVLTQLGKILGRQFREVDMVARYGGEEFAVVLPEINGRVAKGVAERVRRAVATTPFVLPDGREIGVTVSIGVSCYPDCAASSETAVNSADQALYIAKQAGRDRVLLYRETLKARIEKDPDIIVNLLRENPDNVLPVVTAVAAKAPFLRPHTDKVLEAAALLAQALGLSAKERDTLRLAAQLHDIGMAPVPDALCAKTTALTPEEWEIVKQHPVTGAAYLEQVPELRHLAPLVRHHHERYNGAGYPDGLQGEAMPKLARVLAVADAYGAMISDWPGHTAVPPAQARERLRAGAGTQFDPVMVDALLRALERGVA